MRRTVAALIDWYRNTSLQIKTLVGIGVMFAVLLAILTMVFRVFMLDSLRAVEQAMARNSVEQVRAALASVEQRLAATAADWATWDDTYNFATARPAGYIKENLTLTAFKNLQVNIMLLVDRDGRQVFGKQVDLVTETEQPMPEELVIRFQDRTDFLQPILQDRPAAGLLLVDGRPLIAAFHPVKHSNNTGPANGVLLVGRWLDSLETNRLRGMVRYAFTLEPLSALPAHGAAARAAAALTVAGGPDGILVEPQTQTLVMAHVLLRDIHQEPRFLLSVPRERTVFRFGFQGLWDFVLWLVGITVVFAVLTAFIIHRSVTARVQLLNRELDTIRRQADPALRLALTGTDEIGRLATAVNNTLAALVQAQENLRTSERKYRILFDSIQRGFALAEVIYREPEHVPIDFRFIEANSALEQIMGIPRERLIGKTAVEIYQTPDTFMIRMCQKVAASGQAEHFEYYNHEFDKFLEVAMFASQPGLLAIMFTDISDRKQAEKEQQARQTQDLQAQKLQAMGQLAGGIAHDFNNMLGVIGGYAELIEAKFAPGNETLQKYIGAISRSAKRMAELATQLLTFSHKNELRLVSLNIHEVIADVVQLLERTLDRRISIKRQLAAASPVLAGDPGLLQNALMNLAINARDAMPEGGLLTFTTETVRLDETAARRIQPLQITPGAYLRVSVGDTGIGMDQKTFNRLFEPFFTTKDIGQGTGLGLASVFGTMAAHHGGIEVFTAPGQGTTFHLYLPQAQAGTVASQPDTALPPHLPRGSGTVLVVDDEAEDRQLAADLLQDLGYTARLAASGQEAVDDYHAHHAQIDAVLLDMVMPGLGGYDCFQAFKAIRADVQVLVISGYAMNAEVKRVLASGPAGYLPKPLDIHQLALALQKVVPPKAAGSPDQKPV